MQAPYPTYCPLVLTSPGQSSLPQACPVCLHEPVKADDCRPNKALRTTIKVFLRKKGIEREAARKKELLDNTIVSATFSTNSFVDNRKESSPSQGLATLVSDKGEPNGVAAQASSGIRNIVEPKSDPSIHTPQSSQVEDQIDIPRPSVEVSNFPNFSPRRLLMTSSLPTTKVIPTTSR